MKKDIMSVVFSLFLLLGLVPGLAIGEKVEKPDAVTEEAIVEPEVKPPQENNNETAATEESNWLPVASTSSIICTCDCVCPASGASEQQSFKAPPWIAGCSQFNGDTCSVGPYDTCNTLREYQNCQ